MLVQDHSKDMHDTIYDEEETLSLSDCLPLNSSTCGVGNWEDDLSVESQRPSSEQDCFEFLNQEHDPCFPLEDIIFCGKLVVPYKQLDTIQKESSEVVNKNKRSTDHIKTKRIWQLFRSKFEHSSLVSSKKQVDIKNCKKATTLAHKSDRSPRRMCSCNNKHGKAHDSPVHKMSTLTSISSGNKAGRYLFFFKFPRLSSKVELRDIKSLQSNRKCQRLQPLTTLSYPNRDGKVSRSTGSGLWRLVSVLSCDSSYYQPNTMVVASIRRITTN